MAVLFTDGFDRANGGLGSDWTAIDSSFTISGNLVVPTSTGSDALQTVTLVTWPDDQYCQIVLGGMAVHAADIGIGLALRTANTNNHYRITANSSNSQVGKVVGGAFTPLSTLGVGWANGDVLYAEVQGNTLKVMKNGVQVGSNIAGDAALASGDVGLFYSSTAATATADDFEGGDFVEPPSGSPVRESYIRRSRRTSW